METLVASPPAPETGPSTDAAFAGIVAELHPQMLETSGAAANLEHLQGLHDRGRITGFDESEWSVTASQLITSGYPLENIDAIDRQENTAETNDVLAQWQFADRRLSLFDLHYHEHGEHGHAQSLGTMIHELGHMASPYHAENNSIYGGPEKRAQAAQYVANVAEQSLFTNIHLNGYHRLLLDEFTSTRSNLDSMLQFGMVSEQDHAYYLAHARGKLYEETSAIMQQMAIVNRGGLESVEERQHRAWDDKVRMIKDPNVYVPDKTQLLTHAEMPGEAAAGIDKHLLDVLPDVDSYDELVEHVKGLKALFYPDDKLYLAETRNMRRESGYYFNRAISHLGFSAREFAEFGPDVAVIYNLEDDENEKYKLSGLDEAV